MRVVIWRSENENSNFCKMAVCIRYKLQNMLKFYNCSISEECTISHHYRRTLTWLAQWTSHNFTCSFLSTLMGWVCIGMHEKIFIASNSHLPPQNIAESKHERSTRLYASRRALDICKTYNCPNHFFRKRAVNKGRLCNQFNFPESASNGGM